MNEPVPLSSFGVFTNECAQLYCKDKDGLNLWLSLINECYINYETDKETENEYYNQNNKRMLLENNDVLYSSLSVCIICSFVGILCFMISYIITYIVINSIINVINTENNDNNYNNDNKKE